MSEVKGANKTQGQASPKEWNKQLAETLDEMGFAHKPGSTKGRMYSSRFYHAELIKVITALKDAEVERVIGQDEVVHFTGDPEKATDTMRGFYYNQLRAEQRLRAKELK